MPDLTWTTQQMRLGDLREWERNPRQLSEHDAKHIGKSIETFGLADPLIVNLDGQLIGGHQRKRVMLLNGATADTLVDVRVPSRQLTEREAEELAVRLNKNTGSWDFDVLGNEFEIDDLLDWGFTEFDLGIRDDGKDAAEEDDGPQLEKADVPDAIWPTDNDWGVPVLDANLQATALVAPFSCWGATKRKARMPGTWHFYTEDYRYNALWDDPSGVVNTRCQAVVEPNFSCYADMPPAVALWNIYRKRWLARWWQSFGIRVFVDLNVAVRHADLNMLGVPQGWTAWATRGYSDRLADTEREYGLAIERAGTSSILFVVYGGGKAVTELCLERGWIWYNEVMD